jgi:hypothetical protein
LREDVRHTNLVHRTNYFRSADNSDYYNGPDTSAYERLVGVP